MHVSTEKQLRRVYMERRIVSTNEAPAAVGPYSQAVVVGDLVFASGNIALDPETGEMVGQDIVSQTRQALENLGSVLRAAGSSLDRVIKTTVFLASIGDFAAMNSVYAEFFPGDPPARSTLEVGALPKAALVEIEAVAIR
jgi:2-iminobutanoate/2-iminopropanoate deaminase